MKWPFEENAGFAWREWHFFTNSILPEMCHLSSQPTLLSHESRFMMKNCLKIKVPDSSVRMALFRKIKVTIEFAIVKNPRVHKFSAKR
jgi:hypothetical protein